MNLKLCKDDVLFCIELYLASKGMKTKSEDYTFHWNKYHGLTGVTVDDVIPAKYDLDKVIECAKNK